MTTVRELRELLFNLQDQDAEIKGTLWTRIDTVFDEQGDKRD